MNEKSYPFQISTANIRYSFESVSEEKIIEKAVVFVETNYPNIYNLALVDILGDGTESDITVSNNNDLETVMATVIKIIDDFLNKFPDKSVIFQGSDLRRTRLYRIIISREYESISQYFKILGLKNGLFHQFESKIEFDAFLICKL